MAPAGRLALAWKDFHRPWVIIITPPLKYLPIFGFLFTQTRKAFYAHFMPEEYTPGEQFTPENTSPERLSNLNRECPSTE